MDGIRFDGLYHHDGMALWLRFHPEGEVTGRFVRGDVTPQEAASLIWVGLGGYASGRYVIDGDAIDLHMKFPMGDWHYSGKLVEGGVELKYIQEGKDFSPRVYGFQPLTDVELAPPQIPRAHLLRERLSSGNVDRSRVEAAAAIGDPVSMLALQGYLDVARIAQHFAPLGAPACLRVLFALSWSDDGEWFEPKQGVRSGGGRKDDEGKTLRALAKWCLKPDEKALAKAQQEFREVIKVGPAAKFLEHALQIIAAASEGERVSALKAALTLHLDQDSFGAFELVRERVLPWLMGTGDPLADMLKKIK